MFLQNFVHNLNALILIQLRRLICQNTLCFFLNLIRKEINKIQKRFYIKM